MRPEDKLAQQLSNYLRLEYPNVIFHFDTGAGASLSIGMAMRNKRLNRWQGWPDLFIAQPYLQYKGLFMELKVKSPFKKDGLLRSDERLTLQRAMQALLQEKGYKAIFGTGFEECKKIIDEYLVTYKKPN